jgi:GxxExxY protein
MVENPISNKIIGAAIRVHKELGPGLLESAYENCLAYVLLEHGLHVEKQKPLPLVFQGVKLEAGFRVDLLVDQKVVVEIKSVDAIADIHVAQVLTYLKLSGCRLGLIINFNTIFLKDGIRRVTNG